MYDAGDKGELQQLKYTCRKIEQRRQQLRQQQKDIAAALADLEEIQDRCTTHMDLLNKQLCKQTQNSSNEESTS